LFGATAGFSPASVVKSFSLQDALTEPNTARSIVF